MSYQHDKDRVIFSVKPKALGLRPPKMVVSGTYDVFLNGLNIPASGSVYLSGPSGMFNNEVILDAMYIGAEFDFVRESEYSIRIPDVTPRTEGEIDAILLVDNILDVVSENYDWGKYTIDVTKPVVRQ